MSFRERIRSNPETLEEFELAWRMRYAEGMLLLDNPKTRSGGVYLLGYVVEMILKTAYFRFVGAKSQDQIDALLTAIAFKSAAKKLPVDVESYHSLLFWMELLVTARDQQRRRLPAHLHTALRSYSEILHENWLVEIRYHSLEPAAEEWHAVQEAVNWFNNHHASLWQ